ncbi:MAG: glycoside hydrolase family 130 protein [Acidimicrobiia bacterium]|nr:glycoside hydrolase family 130 protein [Acidimicrobiia bacterium]
MVTSTQSDRVGPEVNRTGIEINPDPTRVVLKPHLSSEPILADDGLLDRILAMTEQDVTAALTSAMSRFANRHPNLVADLENHYRVVAKEAGTLGRLSKNRTLLIGTYYTREFSVEAASLTNPSIVPAPDQNGLEPGALRFIISLRGIGEGHVSSIEFRSGVIDHLGNITMDARSPYAQTGAHEPAVFDKDLFCTMLMEMNAFDDTAASMCLPLPNPFTLEELEDTITAAEGKQAPRHVALPSTKAMEWLATSNYVLVFPPNSELSERVIFPGSPVESHGLEDARFVRFVDDDGAVTYYATYTAYDGSHVLPQLIETKDFVSFRMDTLSGQCAQNKGVALFPRKIDGRFVALSRYDTKNNYVMQSDNIRLWDQSQMIEAPQYSWNLARIGNGGSPLETDAGWLVITHGVGPFRTYSLGAILLDIDDPTKVIGRLKEPLLIASEDEREGYVPNVVYTCGAMIHGSHLVLPYGISDTACRVATLPVDSVLGAMERS